MASGAYDVAMALGVEKMKDRGYQGLDAAPPPNDGTGRTLTAAAMFSMVAPAYAQRTASIRRRCPRRWHASRRRTTPTAPATRGPSSVARSRRRRSPMRRASQGRSACSTAPGSPTGRPPRSSCRAEDAHRYTDHPIYVKALSFVAGNGSGLTDPAYDYTTFPEVVACAADAYAQAGISDPAAELAHGRGARLLHDHRARPDGGPRVRRAGHRVEGGARRTLRPRRRAPGEPRRRAQVASAIPSGRPGCA